MSAADLPPGAGQADPDGTGNAAALAAILARRIMEPAADPRARFTTLTSHLRIRSVDGR